MALTKGLRSCSRRSSRQKAASGLEAHTVCRTSISDEAAAGANMLLLEKTSDTPELVDGDVLDAEVDECVRPNCNGGAL